MTDNRKARRKAKSSKTERSRKAEISRKSYAEVVINTTDKDVDFYRIYENLVIDEKSNSSLIETSPPVMCTNSAHVTNHSCSFVEEKDTLFSTQDKEILSILEELEETANVSAISRTRLSGYFCSDTVFNLSRRVVTELEIKIWIKVLTMLLSKINSTSRNLSRILRSFVLKCVLNGLFVMNLLLNLVLRLHLIPNLRGNLLMVVLVWNFF